jgi:hypothetical protein
MLEFRRNWHRHQPQPAAPAEMAAKILAAMKNPPQAIETHGGLQAASGDFQHVN